MTTMSEHRTPVAVDLTNVGMIAGEALRLLRQLNGQRPDPADKPLMAAVKRDLIYLADIFDRASAEVRAQYHAQNGRPDILEELHD